jgi:hypothetical protein
MVDARAPQLADPALESLRARDSRGALASLARTPRAGNPAHACSSTSTGSLSRDGRMKAPLDRAWIERNLPHQGRMSLLDEIVAFDDTHAARVRARTATRDHPLRVRGELPAVCGIEYGAQAAAAHGALRSRIPRAPASSPACAP